MEFKVGDEEKALTWTPGESTIQVFVEANWDGPLNQTQPECEIGGKVRPLTWTQPAIDFQEIVWKKWDLDNIPRKDRTDEQCKELRNLWRRIHASKDMFPQVNVKRLAKTSRERKAASREKQNDEEFNQELDANKKRNSKPESKAAAKARIAAMNQLQRDHERENAKHYNRKYRNKMSIEEKDMAKEKDRLRRQDVRQKVIREENMATEA